MNKFTKNNRNKKEGETTMTKGRYGTMVDSTFRDH